MPLNEENRMPERELDSSSSGQQQAAGDCNRGSELWGCTKCGEFMDYPRVISF
jgi:hypothetical protein